jgi:plasmid stabilization system protein ParE
MACKYSFDPAAADEYEEAFDWYEERSLIAADGLIVAVQDAITAICANPDRYRNTYKNFHEITLKKYPYNLVYYIDETRKLITITSIYHHKRNPKEKYIKQKTRKK